jgi:phenylpyruvate tautomerase PptA (4-oxalocrotonate tautomerase family)
MPMIQCDIRRGRTPAQIQRLVSDLVEIVHEVTGAPAEMISTVVRELPGSMTFEGTDPSPEYRPGPDGVDLAGAEDVRRRQKGN